MEHDSPQLVPKNCLKNSSGYTLRERKISSFSILKFWDRSIGLKHGSHQRKTVQGYSSKTIKELKIIVIYTAKNNQGANNGISKP